MNGQSPDRYAIAPPPTGAGRWRGAPLALSWLVTLLVPLALVLGGLRLLLTPAFLQLEYRTPGFPEDPYGFSRADRLRWARLSLEYLLNDAGVEFVGDLRFADGSPVFNGRELEHFVDVKNVLRVALGLWYAALALLLGCGVWARLRGWWPAYLLGLQRGGWLTVLLLGTLLLLILLAFNVFFIAFHEVLFPAGTWTFEFSDTFIRLFPERFWRDAFLLVGAIALAGGLALGLGLKRP
jgi:integral membrane protein (TIGR01906 family)